MPSALGITVPAELLDRWRGWFAPATQPFPTARLADRDAATVAAGRRVEPSPEVRDTFHLYGAAQLWLTEPEFRGLSLRLRRDLLSGREATGRLRDLAATSRRAVEPDRTDSRIVWWPSVIDRVGDRPVLDHVDDGVRPSRHREIRRSGWTAAARRLPGAADLAGTHPPGSGPNCFGTVMATAGVPGAETEWMQREPFERWLTTQATPFRGPDRDDTPGIVLVWRTAEGRADHAAVTLGGGYALSKPSQAWCSPRLVWTVPETIMASRCPGLRLHRYRLTDSDPC